MSNAPAHKGLSPSPFQFEPVSEQVKNLIAAVQPVASLERAHHASRLPLGYYRAILEDNRQLFLKVVSPERAPLIEHSSKLGNRIAKFDIPVSYFLSGPLPLANGDILFVYEWVDGVFFDGSFKMLDSIGTLLARLHEVLPQLIDKNSVQCRLEEDFKRISALAADGTGWSTADRHAKQLLQNWANVTRDLTRDCQPIHNDLHPGNILFCNDGRVAAVLDFEECLTSRFNPAVDLSWIIERWCLLHEGGGDGRVAGNFFLEAYFRNSSRGNGCSFDEVVTISQYRCVAALALIWQRRSKNDLHSDEEWGKFISILERLSSF